MRRREVVAFFLFLSTFCFSLARFFSLLSFSHLLSYTPLLPSFFCRTRSRLYSDRLVSCKVGFAFLVRPRGRKECKSQHCTLYYNQRALEASKLILDRSLHREGLTS
jgi:hypothetical protein